jgi:ABC-type multidrug transport system fused ATPase/permease subunit
VPNRPAKPGSYALLLGPIWRHRGWGALTVLALLTSALAWVAVAWAIRLTIDGLQFHQAAQFVRGITVFAACMAAGAGGDALEQYARQRLGLAVVQDLQSVTVGRLIRAPLAFFDRHATGDIQSRLTNDTAQVFNLVSLNAVMLVKQPLVLLLSSVYLVTLSPVLALIVVPIGPLLYAVNWLGRKRLYTQSRRVQEEQARLSQETLDLVSGMSTVKAFSLETYIAQRYRAALDRLRLAHRGEWSTSALLALAAEGITYLPFVVVLIVGGQAVLAGRLEIGSLIAAVQLMNSVVNPFNQIATAWAGLQTGRAALDRIRYLSDVEVEALGPAVPVPAVARPAPDPPEVVADAVSFRYDDGQEALLGVSLRVPAGRLTVLGGPNGSGKSTFVKLLLRFYRPTGGTLLWDGHRLEDLPLAAVRRWVVYVPQEPLLLADTVETNLRLADPEADRDRLVAALREVGLPAELLDRPVGERGRHLSGGQRLRVALARALLRDGPLWVLDEPTAALDADGASVVVQLLRRLAGSRTVVVVSHDHRLLAAADHAIWLEHGRVAATPLPG